MGPSALTGKVAVAVRAPAALQFVELGHNCLVVGARRAQHAPIVSPVKIALKTGWRRHEGSVQEPHGLLSSLRAASFEPLETFQSRDGKHRWVLGTEVCRQPYAQAACLL